MIPTPEEMQARKDRIKTLMFSTSAEKAQRSKEACQKAVEIIEPLIRDQMKDSPPSKLLDD